MRSCPLDLEHLNLINVSFIYNGFTAKLAFNPLSKVYNTADRSVFRSDIMNGAEGDGTTYCREAAIKNIVTNIAQGKYNQYEILTCIYISISLGNRIGYGLARDHSPHSPSQSRER